MDFFLGALVFLIGCLTGAAVAKSSFEMGRQAQEDE